MHLYQRRKVYFSTWKQMRKQSCKGLRSTEIIISLDYCDVLVNCQCHYYLTLLMSMHVLNSGDHEYTLHWWHLGWSLMFTCNFIMLFVWLIWWLVNLCLEKYFSIFFTMLSIYQSIYVCILDNLLHSANGIFFFGFYGPFHWLLAPDHIASIL